MHRWSTGLLVIAGVAAGVGVVCALKMGRRRVDRANHQAPAVLREVVAPEGGSDPEPPGKDRLIVAEAGAMVRLVSNHPVDVDGLRAPPARSGSEHDAADPQGDRPQDLPVITVALPREGVFSWPMLIGLAVVAGLVAVGLGAWTFASQGEKSATRSVTVMQSPRAVAQAITLLASQATDRVPLAHSAGRIVLVVGARNRAVLVLEGLGRAPAGRAYQVWVTPRGKGSPVSAAVFSGSELVVRLKRVVAPGATVAVTIERAGGARHPTRVPKLVARRAL